MHLLIETPIHPGPMWGQCGGIFYGILTAWLARGGGGFSEFA